METEILTQIEQLIPHRDRWNRLAGHNPFLSWEWIESWWAGFGSGHDLFVVLVKDEQGEIVGIAPWYRSASIWGGTLRFLGSHYTCSDYLRVLVSPCRESTVSVVLAKLLRQVAGKRLLQDPFYRLEFDGVGATDMGLQSLGRELRANGFRVRPEQIESTWRILLTCDWPEFVRNLTYGCRRKAQKITKRLDRGEVQFCASQRTDDTEPLLNLLIDLHQRRRNQVGDEGCFADPRFTVFLRMAAQRMCQTGKARFTWCERHGQPISIQLQLLGDRTIYVYQSGMDPEMRDFEPGHTMVAGAIRSAIEERYHVYDLLRGDEPYKAYWSATPSPLQRMVLTAPAWHARLLDTASMSVSEVKRLLRTAVHSPRTAGAR